MMRYYYYPVQICTESKAALPRTPYMKVPIDFHMSPSEICKCINKEYNKNQDRYPFMSGYEDVELCIDYMPFKQFTTFFEAEKAGMVFTEQLYLYLIFREK